jgi:hypothetical protein
MKSLIAALGLTLFALLAAGCASTPSDPDSAQTEDRNDGRIPSGMY